MDGQRQKQIAQRMPSGRKETWCDNYALFKQEDLYKIPEALVEDVLKAVGIVCFGWWMHLPLQNTVPCHWVSSCGVAFVKDK